MSTCFDQGQLRAYLDGELSPIERAALGAHADGCPHCTAELAALREHTARLRTLLAPAPLPDAQSALARARTGSQAPALPATADAAPALPRRIAMQSLAFFGSGRRRAALGAVAALVIVLSLLALPPVRAAADNLLSVFRVQKVVFVPIDQARLQQLGALKLDKGALFVGEPATSNRQPPRTVGSAAEAAAAIGQPLLQPANLPAAPSSTTFTVNNGGQASFQINLDTARTVLDALDIRDVTLPDALGTAPITVDVPIFASTRYQGASYELTLHQSASPNVTLPDGVDMAQLGKATLRVLGMSPEQAEVVSSQINWNNTLLFPFPTDANNIRQVNVASDTGLLVTGGERNHQRGMLYWQHNGIMYMLEGRSDGANDEMIADMLLNAAESLQ